jgi:hypothetical protein
VLLYTNIVLLLLKFASAHLANLLYWLTIQKLQDNSHLFVPSFLVHIV